SGATAYNRGQVLYRVAEMLEGRRAQFVAEVAEAEGLAPAEAGAQVDAAVDRWVWYAGWSDKIAQVHGSSNPVAGPFFNFSVLEPTGVVAVTAPQQSSLLGLVSVVAPVVVTGNTAVVLASELRPLPAITLAEVLATSDLPGGVLNLLTGRLAEVAPWLASHMDVNAIDLSGVPADLAVELERQAAENLKRVVRPPAVEPSWTDEPGLGRILDFLETKTVWHPVGVEPSPLPIPDPEVGQGPTRNSIGSAGMARNSHLPWGEEVAMTTLYRPRDRRIVAGVCAGLGRRFDVSPNLFRLIAILFLFLPGSSILAYAILWVVMPDEEQAPRAPTAPPPSSAPSR